MNDEVAQNEKYIPNEKPRKRRNVWIISCGVILLILACICSSFLLFSGSLFSSASGYSSNSSLDISENKVMELGTGSSFSNEKIAVIEIADVINFATQNDTSSGTNNKTVNAQLQKAKDDPQVKAIILRFNTPGGAVNAAEPICHMIKEVDKEKPVYSFIDSEGASLGYLLPNCTRMIYASPMAITGSIGVRADLVDYNGILTNLGAKSTTITNSAGTEKTQSGLFDKNSDEYKRYQSILDEVYMYFVNTVYAGRQRAGSKITKEQLMSYANGQIFSGTQAEKLGLVDKLGEYPDVLEAVYKNLKTDQKVDVVEYNVNVSPFAGIFGSLDKISNMFIHKESGTELRIMMLK